MCHRSPFGRPAFIQGFQMSMFKGAFFGITAAVLLSTSCLAQTSGYSGSSGTTAPPAANAPALTTALGKPITPAEATALQPAVTMPQVATPAMPVSPMTPVAPTAPANIASTLPGAPPAQPTVDTQKTDPCAQYMYSYNAYVVCQDRMQKIDRMKAANTKRMDAFKAPPAPPPVVAAPPAANGKAAPAGAAPANGATPAAATPAAATPGTAATPVIK